MSVTSQPLAQSPQQAQPQRGGRKFDPGVFAGALIGVLIGAVAWIFGAKYTIDGIISGVNTILAFLTIPYRVGMRWDLYLWLAPLPVCFSAVEWACNPFGHHRTKHFGLIIAWLVVVALDLGTTALGLAAAKSPVLIVWIASISVLQIVLATVLTFGPEAMMKSCGALFMRAVRALFR